MQGANAGSFIPHSALGQQKPKTVGEVINEAIEQHNLEIARLIALRADCQLKGLLNLPQPLVASAAHPSNPW